MCIGNEARAGIKRVVWKFGLLHKFEGFGIQDQYNINNDIIINNNNNNKQQK